MDAPQLADYCRAVEAHLTRVNGGHLVRVVGPGFAVVREWHADGIPLSIVERGIEQKSERHRQGSAGRVGRPLRIEFCDADVRALFEDWRRAVGVTRATAEAAETPAHDGASLHAAHDRHTAGRRPSLSKHLERVSARLARLLGRHDLPEDFLTRVNDTIAAVADVRERAAHARGAAKAPLLERLRALDRPLVDAALAAMTTADRSAIDALATQELGAFRDRLAPLAWQEALTATRDRLVREKFGLPVVEMETFE